MSERLACRVGKDRVERISTLRTKTCPWGPPVWRREGLKVPKKQKARGRLWLNDGSCVRLLPQHQNHVWSYDFVSTRTYDGRAVRLLNLIDEHTRGCLLIRAGRRWSVHYNTVRPHSSLGYRPPAPVAWQPANNKGHGEVETATYPSEHSSPGIPGTRFPLLHTPDGGYLSTPVTAPH